MEEPVTVVLADDDALVRLCLRLILTNHPGIQVVGEAGDGEGAVDVVGDVTPAVVLMDIRMPGMDGIEATRQIMQRQGHRPAVLVLTTLETDELLVDALRAGASGFLLKSARPDDLASAITSVAAGEPVLSPEVTRRLISTVTDSAPRQSGGQRAKAQESLRLLSDREREVAVALASGWTNAEIAQRLYMGVPTVKAHVSSVLTKLAMDNRTQVAVLVHDAGWGGSGPRDGPVPP
jgi:DNA-binding NarL/FixJ family response regulator